MSKTKHVSGAEGSKQKRNDDPLNLDHPAIVQRREAVQREINRFNYKVDPERFMKTPKEKIELANEKKKHNKALKLAGFLPSKRLNLSAPQKMMLRTVL